MANLAVGLSRPTVLYSCGCQTPLFKGTLPLSNQGLSTMTLDHCAPLARPQHDCTVHHQPTTSSILTKALRLPLAGLKAIISLWGTVQTSPFSLIPNLWHKQQQKHKTLGYNIIITMTTALCPFKKANLPLVQRAPQPGDLVISGSLAIPAGSKADKHPKVSLLGRSSFPWHLPGRDSPVNPSLGLICSPSPGQLTACSCLLTASLALANWQLLRPACPAMLHGWAAFILK